MLRLTDVQALALHGMLTELTTSSLTRLTPEQRDVCDAVALWWMDQGSTLANGITEYAQNEREE